MFVNESESFCYLLFVWVCLYVGFVYFDGFVLLYLLWFSAKVFLFLPGFNVCSNVVCVCMFGIVIHICLAIFFVVILCECVCLVVGFRKNKGLRFHLSFFCCCCCLLSYKSCCSIKCVIVRKPEILIIKYNCCCFIKH